MIPDATTIAAGGTIVNSAMTAYPILPVVLAFVVVISFGVVMIIGIRRALPKR